MRGLSGKIHGTTPGVFALAMLNLRIWRVLWRRLTLTLLVAEDDGKYAGLPERISDVMQPPSGDDALDFDLSPVNPAIVKTVLSRRPSGAYPGEDRIIYHHLKMLPSTHHFLATLF